jgi:tetratricopeptide (TPR) repeat protein
MFAGLACVVISVALWTGLFGGGPSPQDIWAAYQAGGQYTALEITYPFDGALFPPEIIAPTFRWKDKNTQADTWLVWIEFTDKKDALGFVVRKQQWTPPGKQWDAIKRRSLETNARVSIVGVKQDAPEKILSAGEITISTSKDEVGAPLFYREVNLPFSDAVRDPTRIRWRFGEISSKTQPPIILEKLPVCGNCHSFSADGTVLGMDVDYASDKGSYAISPVAEEMLLDKNRVITWSDYKRDDKQSTFGLLSQVSPNGKYVISTVKDRSVFVPMPDLAYSQLFFPIQGILAYYRRDTESFHALPGADNKEFVQSNAAWSPDGKTIVFARSKTYHLKEARGSQSVLLVAEECKEFLQEGKKFMFDLYQIPFNDGKGGQAQPLEGASNNGMSNFFPRYSPDGKWIVFCKAKSFMLLQPDSELYIMPAEGGQARRMRCNTSQMNSWHSWSPNGKWMVFSSKANGPYTQLWLTHIDQHGASSPPVLLENFSAADRAANIPEFVNAKPGTIKKISQQFVDDFSLTRAGNEFLYANDLQGAARSYRKALDINPNNADAHNRLAAILIKQNKLVEAIKHFNKAVEIEPNNATVHTNLGAILIRTGKINEGIEHYSKAIEINPKHDLAHYNWAIILARHRKLDDAIKHFRKTVEINPGHASAYYNIGIILGKQRKFDQAIECYTKALELNPKHAPTHNNLGITLCQQGKFAKGAEHFRKALEINPKFISASNNLARALQELRLK